MSPLDERLLALIGENSPTIIGVNGGLDSLDGGLALGLLDQPSAVARHPVGSLEATQDAQW